MGEPLGIDALDKKAEKDGKTLQNYSYDKDKIHYEFIVADNKVVRVTLYSEKNQQNQGDDFKYEDDPADLLAKFGIVVDDDVKDDKVNPDKRTECTFSTISDKIDAFHIADIDLEEKTFGEAVITYDKKYFPQK